MKKLVLYLFCCCLLRTATAQYYLKGIVSDNNGNPLENVHILMRSTHLTYYTDNYGTFGIPMSALDDSAYISLNGYESKTIAVNATGYWSITLNAIISKAFISNHTLVSISGNTNASDRVKLYQGSESYFSQVENQAIQTKDQAKATFALNIDKASYSNIRRFLNQGSEVPPDAVRTEEFLNYFDLHYNQPAAKDLFKIESQLTGCPWSPDDRLLYLDISAQKLDLSGIPPSNLVFLIDASGSMDMPNKLSVIKAAFQMLVKNLRPVDSVSMIVFGGNVTLWLKSTSGAEGKKIIEAIEQINADGETPGEAAIKLAYQTAENAFIPGGNNRVILATDGDFNVGKSHEEELERLIAKERLSGIYLTCLGVGAGNLKDSNLQTLANKGNGNYAYLDDIHEAQRVLVEEMTKNLYAVADNVYLDVDFNPDVIRSYRLIGFNNPKAALADSMSLLEGGEIGSGNGLTAVFQVTAVSNAMMDSCVSKEGNVAKVTLNYSLPHSKERRQLEYFCPDNYLRFDSVDKAYKLGAALVMFAMKLRRSPYLVNVDWNAIESLAIRACDPQEYLQEEFLRLINTAKKIYMAKKKKKKRAADDDN